MTSINSLWSDGLAKRRLEMEAFRIPFFPNAIARSEVGSSHCD
jgi:hypothetical protein